MKNLLVFLFIFLVASCTKAKQYDLKSPCVSGKNGPCERRPVNQEFLSDF